MVVAVEGVENRDRLCCDIVHKIQTVTEHLVDGKKIGDELATSYPWKNNGHIFSHSACSFALLPNHNSHHCFVLLMSELMLYIFLEF